MYNSMNYIGKFISNFRDFYNEINAATLTGAIDVIVVQQPDGSYNCSPFHVRFGKLGVLRSREKVVDIEINGEPRQIHMKLGDSGEAFFVEEVKYGSPIDIEIPPHLACSPIPHEDCFPARVTGFNAFSDLPQAQHEKILRDSVLSIEREKWEQMSALPPDQREQFLVEHFSDLPIEQREKWLQIASLTSAERDKMFQEHYGNISTEQKQQMIREQYSQLKLEDKEKLFKENFPELPKDQRQKFEKALLSDWKNDKDNKDENADDEDDDVDDDDNDDEEKDKLNFNDDDIFDMEGINLDEKPKLNPKLFSAVTSSDRLRKISVVKNDFRPIGNKYKDSQFEIKGKSSDESANSHNSSSSTTSKKNSKDESDDIKNGAKRKRKRKSVMKRKSSQRKISSNTNSLDDSISNYQQIENEISGERSQKKDSNDEERKIKNSPRNNRLEQLGASHNSTDFHFFSDTEITKDRDSRPSSPIQSDTEFEVNKITQENSGNEITDNSQSWKWGELPSSTSIDTRISSVNTVDPNSETAEARRSMLGGMFSFMKKTSRVRHNPESEGIYLSDLNPDELDPEVAALYFPSSHRGQNKTKSDEDAESGNGPSLPQSPNSVEGAIGGPKSLDSDYEGSSKLCSYEPNISLSLCGGLNSEQDLNDETFQRHILHYEDVCADPKIYENPNLVIKINNKYYNWESACPLVVTYAVFHRHLPENAVSNAYDEKKRLSDSKPEIRSGYSSWFSWRRSEPKETSPSSTKTDDNLVAVTIDANDKPTTSTNKEESKEESEIIVELPPVLDKSNDCIVEMKNEIDGDVKPTDSVIIINDGIKDENSTLKNEEVKDIEKTSCNVSFEDLEDENKRNSLTPLTLPLPTLRASPLGQKRPYHESIEKYRKTLRLSSEQIASLELKDGANEVVFSVTTAYQGTTRCKCHIYKWRWDDKIVISDIDGTITKSDVLGHILPIVGKDWAQSGVAQLFTKIKNNGYKLLYLSARAIGQAKVTREYLKSIKQGDLSLPDGPLLLNPTSLISAFHREVIEKKPEEFKISCLSDIQALFPEGSQPFYAGYGNRINDVWAYRAVGIPITRIFTINHRGELKHELTQTFQSSYSNMSYIVDHMFPTDCYRAAADEFSNFSFWREPIPEVPKLESLDTQS